MYKIMGRYNGGEPEEIDTAETGSEAAYLLGEYTLAYSNEWELWIEGD